MKRINKLILAFLFVLSAIQVYPLPNDIESPVVTLANDISTSSTEFKTIINESNGFNAWLVLNKEAPTLKTNIDELNLVSKNLDEISQAGSYLNWKKKIRGIIDWTAFKSKLTSRLSSAIESSTLTKMVSQMKNGGDDGLHLALRIEKRIKNLLIIL